MPFLPLYFKGSSMNNFRVSKPLYIQNPMFLNTEFFNKSFNLQINIFSCEFIYLIFYNRSCIYILCYPTCIQNTFSALWEGDRVLGWVIKAPLLTSRKDAERWGDIQHPALADPRPITGALQRHVSTSPGEQAERHEVGQEHKRGPQRRGLTSRLLPGLLQENLSSMIQRWNCQDESTEVTIWRIPEGHHFPGRWDTV